MYIINEIIITKYFPFGLGRGKVSVNCYLSNDRPNFMFNYKISLISINNYCPSTTF